MSNGKGSKKKCPICHFKVRGSNHDEGQHHQIALKKLEELKKKVS